MKQDGRALPHDLLEGYRLAAVKLHQRGVPAAALAESFGVTPQAVYAWLQKARDEGVARLRARPAPGREPALDRDDTRELLRILRCRATKWGYATDLWSGPRIRHLLRWYFGVTYHPKHMPRLLRRLGLVIKFPERRALEQDPKALRRWKTERLPDIFAYARRWRAGVFYADESLISLIPYVGKTWAFPQARPIVRVSGQRGQHIGVTAAVNRQGRMCFELTQEKERFTTSVFLRFVRKLRREYPRKRLVLIVDGAPIHVAKLVKRFEAANESWLRLEILPAYSPECNPTEDVWGFVKTKTLNASTAGTKEELRDEAVHALRSLKRKPKRIQSFFEKEE